MTSLIFAAQKLDRDAFAREHGGLYLLRRRGISDEAAIALPFDTIRTPLTSFEVELPPSSPVCQLARIEKRAGNPYPDRISVGRATNCDIVLRHGSVSKLHAHFTTRGNDSPLRVEDLGSTNGTWVNDATLDARTSTGVARGDRIKFGDLDCELVDGGDLWEFLRG